MTTFSDSFKRTQMATLGDLMIGTRSPLIFRVLTDPEKPRRIGDNGKVRFTIGQIEMSCAGQPITDKEEKNLAFYFMLYGDWLAGEPKARIEDGELLAIEYLAEPKEITPGQGFEMVGTMSGMISERFNKLTAPSGQIERLVPKLEPGSLGIAIRTDYQSPVLPLWRFTVRPVRTADQGS